MRSLRLALAGVFAITMPIAATASGPGSNMRQSICGRPLSGKGKNVGIVAARGRMLSSVDAPFQAREKTLRSLLRVVGCCHLSGL
jgi:hypothetical protein